MARVVLTESKVRALKPGSRRHFVLDALCPGLVVDCTPNGHKSYMLRARFPGGRHAVRRLIGEVGAVSLETARDTARQWLGLLAQGLDPQRELAERKRRVAGEQALTFAAVCASYFQHQLRGRQAARSRKEIERELLPYGASAASATSARATLSRSSMHCAPALDATSVSARAAAIAASSSTTFG
jgi:hypothetical protein